MGYDTITGKVFLFYALSVGVVGGMTIFNSKRSKGAKR